MDFQEIKQTLRTTESTPEELSKMRVWLAGEYAYLASQLTEILRYKAEAWRKLRETVKSDTQATRAWEGLSEGIKEMELRLEMKSMEKIMSAIKTRLEVMGIEARNQY